MGSRYFEGNRLEPSSSCVTQKFNNILSGPLKGTWPHEILFYYVYDDAKQNYLMDHHHTKNLCYTPANELLIFSWNSEFVDEHQLQVSFGWSRLDWTTTASVCEIWLWFESNKNVWKRGASLVTWKVNIEKGKKWCSSVMSNQRKSHIRKKKSKGWKNKMSVSKLSCQWPS